MKNKAGNLNGLQKEKREILYIVMPAYNEEKNIKKVILQWSRIVSFIKTDSVDAKLIVADSGSTDNTHQVLKAAQKNKDFLEVISYTKKEHGPKVLELYRYAIRNGADYIFQTDSDGQTNPDDFLAFWERRDKYDAILGNRKVRGDGKSRWFIEKILCVILRIIFGVKIPDANAPFRLMRSDLVKKYIEMMGCDYNLPNVMLTVYFVYYDNNVIFETISFNARTKGKNSINLGKIVIIGTKAIYDFRIYHNKMKFSKK